MKNQETVTCVFNIDDAQRLATLACKSNEWTILHVIEKSLKNAGFNKPSIIDVYSENGKLKHEIINQREELKKYVRQANK